MTRYLFRLILGLAGLCVLLCYSAVVAQPVAQTVPLTPHFPRPAADSLTYPIADAPALPAARYPRANRLTELRHRRDFQYQTPNTQPVASLWDRFWHWFWRKIEQLFVSEKSRTTVKWFWYAFVLATVVWVVIRVLKLEPNALFGRSPRQTAGYRTEVAETPFAEDLDARLADAEAAGNYRLAVRLGYLLALRQLADRELVRWLPEKTNQQYVRELANGLVRDHFARLTRQFEAAWYGDLHPTATDYALVRNTRAALLKALPNVVSPAPVAP